MHLSLLCLVLLICYTTIVAHIEVHKITGDHNKTDNIEKLPIITGCNRIEKFPVPTHSTFLFLQQQYRLAVGLENSTIETPGETSITVPYEFRISPGKGRGLFVTADVPKGTATWHRKYTKTAIFPDEGTYRRFLKSLPWELACDVLVWTYPYEIIEDDFCGDDGCDDSSDDDEYDESEYYAHIDIDGGSLVNHGSEVDANIGYDESAGICFALSDIKSGSEILMDYGEELDSENLPWFDKIYYDAWADDPFGWDWGMTLGSNGL